MRTLAPAIQARRQARSNNSRLYANTFLHITHNSKHFDSSDEWKEKPLKKQFAYTCSQETNDVDAFLTWKAPNCHSNQWIADAVGLLESDAVF